MSKLNEQELTSLIKDEGVSSNDLNKGRLHTYLKEGLFDSLFFNWVNTLIKMNRTKPFEQDMHAQLRPSEKSETQLKLLSVKWKKICHSKRAFPLLRALCRTYIKDLLLLIFLGLLNCVLFFSTPITINLLMKFIAEPKPSAQHALSLAILIPCIRIFHALVDSNSKFLIEILGVKLKSSLIGLIYSKILNISLIRSKDHSIGSIVNLYEVDSEKVKKMITLLPDLLILPLQIMIGIGIIYYLVGTSFLAGLAVMGIVSGTSYIFTKKTAMLQEKLMAFKDERMKLLSEILNGIRYIKMSGCEEGFGNKLDKVRSKELEVLKKRWDIITIWVVNFLLGPQGVLMATLGIFILQGGTFDVTKIITMASTFWVLANPFQNVTWVVSIVIDSRVSMKRLEKFLLSEDIDQSYITKKARSNDKVALKISNGNFSWESTDKNAEILITEESHINVELSETSFVRDLKETEPSEMSLKSTDPSKNYKFRLQDINLEVKKGSFVAIIGDIGSGKSSLFYSLLGEMSYSKGNLPQVTINGNLAFLPQKPWIVNATLRENITFGNPFDQQLYEKVIYCAAMESDLKILTNGDLTEIGEKGINLSGGQKARVALARALYNQPDIYLLDDVLSAVDIHVGTHIIEKCFTGHLSEKTRILITHNLDYLKYADYIYVMESGRIINEGSLGYLETTQSFNELMEKNKKKSKDSEEDAENHKNQKKEESKDSKKANDHGDSTNHQHQHDLDNSMEFSTVELEKKSTTEEIIEDLTIAEDRETGHVKFSTIKTFIECWGGVKFFISLFLVSAIKILTVQGTVLYLAHWGDQADQANKYSYLLNYYLINLISFIAQAIAYGMAFARGVKSSKILHRKMVKSVLEAPVNLFFDRVPSGRILNRFSDDIQKNDSETPWKVPCFVQSILFILMNLSICISLSSVVMIFPIIGFMILCRIYYQSYTGLNREIIRLKSISNSPITSHFSETLHGLSVIRSLSQQDRFLENQMKKQDENVKNCIVEGAISQWYALRSCFISMLVVGPICLAILLWKEDLGISVGFGGVLANQITDICSSMSSFLSELASIEGKFISVERCNKFTLIKPEKIEPESHSPLMQANWPSKGEVKFRNYSTKYRPGLPLVLKNLRTTIKSGEKVGIIGRTGSGKSTLMLSLLRILEAESGTIEIDGVRLDQIRLPHLRDKITVIPQDAHLFEGTLRDNLDLLHQYSDEQLRRSLDMVNLSNLVNGKEEGLNVPVKSGGENLSAGERQMVCIARALLKQSKVILIDEATSNIDLNSEEIFLKTIKETCRESTVLTIAHRLKTIINSDRIIVMGEGEIIEEGEPEELLRREDSVFAGMWNEAKRAKQDIIE